MRAANLAVAILACLATVLFVTGLALRSSPPADCVGPDPYGVGCAGAPALDAMLAAFGAALLACSALLAAAALLLLHARRRSARGLPRAACAHRHA